MRFHGENEFENGVQVTNDTVVPQDIDLVAQESPGHKIPGSRQPVSYSGNYIADMPA